MQKRFFWTGIMGMVVMMMLLTSSTYAARQIAVGTSLQQTSGIQVDALKHDTRDDLYRTPYGAVPTNTDVTLRLRAATGDLDSAAVRVYRTADQTEQFLPMVVVATTPEGYDFWETTLNLPSGTSIYWYRFVLTKDGQTLYYEDDTLDADGNYVPYREGSGGTTYDRSPDLSFQISAYDSDFYTPDWMRNGVIYQIFPDRFRNGDPSNDPQDGSDVFYGDLELIYQETWNAPPVDGRRVRTASGVGYFNSDFFGGDLVGITEKLDYLQSLGVTGLYLNPIFEARSNHRYDTADYLAIDPLLGTMEDFRTLVAEADARGMKIILDGVFNHMSSDSRYFDRYHRFEEDGACESMDSLYRSWFYFVAPAGAQPSPCVDDGTGNTYYVSWFNFDSIPKINNNTFETRSFFYRDDDSVVATWGQEGIGGWRLDVGGDIDPGGPDNRFWESFRTAVRSYNPEAVIIGEEWNDASRWLLGPEWDAVMNYRFRRAVIGLVRDSDFVDNDGRIPVLAPSEFEMLIRAIEEDYPPMAFHAMMNLLGSHDTSRLFFVMENDIQLMQQAALLQFGMPGAPTIYYGDEIALDAPSLLDGNVYQDDPYNRAPYPWDDTEGSYYPAPNESVLAYYQALAQTRANNPALREGELITLHADDETETLVFLRRDMAAGNVAIVALNNSDTAQTFDVTVDGLMPADLELLPIFEADSLVMDDGMMSITLQPQSGNMWVGTGDAFVPPSAPENLQAQGGLGNVSLEWDAVEGVGGYVVYRSPVATGGFVMLEDSFVTQTQYEDTTVVSGFRYFYKVAAVGADGLLGELSESVQAVPSADIDSVFYVGEAAGEPIELQLAAGLFYELQAGIRITDFTTAEGITQGVRAEAALIRTDDTDRAAVVWQPMEFLEDMEGADIFTTALAIKSVGEYTATVRFSSNAGNDWTEVFYEDGSSPMIVVVPSDDSEAPDVPTNLAIVRVGVAGVVLEWDAVEADDLYVYRVYRTDPAAQDALIAEVEGTTYTDVAVSAATEYTYRVSAVDNALNESAVSDEVSALVERAKIPVVFIVTVPDYTEGQGDVFIAGSFGEGFPSWDPAGLVMEQLSPTQWTVTLEIDEGQKIEYKYVRGSWEAVEKGSGCEEITNRTLTVDPENMVDGKITVDVDVVAKWRDLDSCG